VTAALSARRKCLLVGVARLLLTLVGVVTFKGAAALPPDPAVEVDGFVTFRNLGSTSEACQLVLDSLNSRFNGASSPHTCGGAYHVTACPTDADIVANTPPLAGSKTLLDRLAQGFYCDAPRYLRDCLIKKHLAPASHFLSQVASRFERLLDGKTLSQVRGFAAAIHVMPNALGSFAHLLA